MKFLTNQVFGKTIFIGDAFHAIHPVLGQGFNMSLKDTQNLCDYLAKMEKLGIQNINFKSITFNNLFNHFKIGLASHIFSTAFISRNKIYNTISTTSIAISQTIPVNLKTKILQKFL
jgi:2-polyprenyl-6-methoxyphenol hydroxylase-like FAD-dependent oxidoreductase